MAETPRHPAETVHDGFRESARSHPGAVALVHGRRHVSYAELDRLSDAYAAQLHRLGVRQGAFVPVRLPRSVRLVGVILGVLKLGAAYALMDGAWPAERVRDEVEQLGAQLLVTDGEAPDGVTVPIWSPATDPASGPLPQVEVRGSDPCCVFFTSGTTGRPKGAVSPHSGVIRLVDPGSDLPFRPDTVIAQTAAQAWDLFSMELWAPLLTGGRAVLIDEPYLTGPLLRELISRDGLNLAWATTSLFNLLVDEDPDCFAGLHTVMTGGERLSPPHCRAFLERHPTITLINGYGPVEATVFTSIRVISLADCDVPGGIPIGREVPRTPVHLLDGERVCADGEVGEICAAGEGLALEYLGDADLTARKFPTIVLNGSPVRVYRTGDLGLRDAAGLLHYRGRADRQLKVRGHRVEPVEVESVISTLPGVGRCVVLPKLGKEGNVVGMLGFVTPTAEPAADAPAREAELLALLRLRVPGYQVPDRLLEVAQIPLMSNGKLDAASLLARLGPATPDDLPVRAASGDPMVESICEVVASVVGIAADRIPLDATLTSLGASSLDAGRVAARLGDLLHRPIPVSQVFRTPTVAGLADWIKRCDPLPATEPVNVDGPAPLSPMQTYMFMEHLFEPDDLAHHTVFSWRIEGRPDRTALRRAIEYVHRRHQILASVFSLDSAPMAQPADLPPPPLREFLVATEAEAHALLGRELGRPFRLEKGDVWQPVFVAVREAPVTLFGVAVHHVAFDGGSVATLGADLAHAYNAYQSNQEPDQPPAPSPAAVAAARDAHLHYIDLAAQRDFWRATVAGIPRLTFPPRSDLAAAPSTRMLQETVPAELVRAVGATASDHAVSPFVVYLTAYADSLAELTGQSDFGIGTSFNRRGSTVLHAAVSCLIDILCLRVHPRSGADTAGSLAATASVTSAAFSAQDLPVYEVAQLLEARPASDRLPLFQTMLLLQDNGAAALPLVGLSTQDFRPIYPGVPAELVTEVWPRPDGTAALVLGYRAECVAPSFCRDLAEAFMTRLRTLTHVSIDAYVRA